MIVIGGKRLMGRVEQHAGTFVVTQFFHINYLPLVPVRSYLVLESGNGPAAPVGSTGIRRCIEIRLHPTSVLAGYLRVWGTLGAAFCVLGALIAGGGSAVFEWLVGAALVASTAAWAFLRLGHLNPEEIAQRQAYAALTHEQVDAALLCRTNEAFRSTLLANVAEGARGLMATGYRASLDPEKDWAQVALDPTVRDRAFLQACFTLARIEWGRAEGGAREALAMQHRQLWDKLRTTPPLLTSTGYSPLP
jgi:hypothetical protein